MPSPLLNSRSFFAPPMTSSPQNKTPQILFLYETSKVILEFDQTHQSLVAHILADLLLSYSTQLQKEGFFLGSNV
jgi:hypothetical protein